MRLGMAYCFYLVAEARQHLGTRMAQIDGEKNTAWDCFRRVWRDFETPHGKADGIGGVVHQSLQGRHHADSSHKSVLADTPWSSAGVRLFPRHLDAKPP